MQHASCSQTLICKQRCNAVTHACVWMWCRTRGSGAAAAFDSTTFWPSACVQFQLLLECTGLRAGVRTASGCRGAFRGSVQNRIDPTYFPDARTHHTSTHGEVRVSERWPCDAVWGTSTSWTSRCDVTPADTLAHNPPAIVVCLVVGIDPCIALLGTVHSLNSHPPPLRAPVRRAGRCVGDAHLV